jgi:hypothetical protein
VWLSDLVVGLLFVAVGIASWMLRRDPNAAESPA